MSYNSTVYRILIASPSDVSEERETTTRLIQNWNDVNSMAKKIVLLPIKWETHSSPTYDVRPQEAINRQLVDSADLVIGLFWTKIGSDTGVEISGTIEEIKRSANNGKDVMIYFSQRGVDPSGIDINQLKALNEFKKDVYKNALVESFGTLNEFSDKLSRHLEYKIRELQKENRAAKTKLKLSFVNYEINELLPNEATIKRIQIKLSKEKLDELAKDLIKKGTIKAKEEFQFKNDVKNYINKENRFPVVLGIQNSDSIIYSDLNIDLQLVFDKTDSAFVAIIGSRENAGIRKYLKNINIKEEFEDNLCSIYDESIEKTAPNTLNINTEPLTIFPNKLRCIKPLIILDPYKTVNIEFQTKILSNSLLESIDNILKLKIEVKFRDLNKDEIESIVNELDSLPF